MSVELGTVFFEFMNVEIGVRKMGKIDVALLGAK